MSEETRSSIFVASSSSHESICYAVQSHLQRDVLVNVWTTAFGPSEYFLESLQKAIASNDFGLFVLAPDDIVERPSSEKYSTPRDNVVLELGMFIAAFGRDRCFLLCPLDKTAYHLATDLGGITTVDYDHARTDARAAVGPACDRLLSQIKKKGRRRYATGSQQSVDSLVNGALQTVCRAVSIPQWPHALNLRVFIFLKEQNELVCRYFWSHSPTKEVRGQVRFPMSEEWATKTAVVRAALRCETVGESIDPVEQEHLASIRPVEPRLKFVLAAPVLDQQGRVFGVVDFDTSSDTGKALLDTDVAASTIYQLSQFLMLALDS